MISKFIDWLKSLFCDKEVYKYDLKVGQWNMLHYHGNRMSAEVKFRTLVKLDKLEVVRWQDPAGIIKEYYYTTFPSPQWVNEIGNLRRGETYLVKVKTEHKGFEF